MAILRIPLCFLALSLAFACTARAVDRDMCTKLAPGMERLAKAVEATVNRENPPEELSERALLEVATKRDPTLLDQFRGYNIHVLRKGKHAVVMICTEDDQFAIMEETPCTDGMDLECPKDKPTQPCAFTVDPQQACGE